MPAFQTLPDDSNPLAELSGLDLADWLWASGILVVAALLGLTAGRLVTRFIDKRVSTFVARLIGRFAAAMFVVVGFVYAPASSCRYAGRSMQVTRCR